MSRARLSFAVTAAALSLFATAPCSMSAQGITTGAITGVVTSDQGQPVEGATIRVTNRSTGVTTAAQTRENGRYFVQSLEVGGPYTVEVRRIGFQPVAQNNITVILSQTTRVDVQLPTQAVSLAQVTTLGNASSQADFSPSHQGVGTIVNDTLIRRLPTLNRDFSDLVKLTPQVSSNPGQGPSAAGGYNRLNNFTVDGANQNDRFDLGSSGGTPGGASNNRIMSVDAVKEFQVLLSPTDVRYGNFAGMLVNAVTKSGTNTLSGGATYAFRTPGMAANVDQIRSSGFNIRQYGFNIGGPIIKDRLHFFAAADWKESTNPTVGPFANASTNTIGTSNIAVSLDSINRIATILAPHFDVGSAGAFPITNPVRNLMGRLDYSINDANRITFRVLDNNATNDAFSRNTNSLASNATQQSTGLRLTSNSFVGNSQNRSYAAQWFNNRASGISNELLFGYNTIRDFRQVPVNVPEISIGVTPNGGTTPSVAVTVGSERFSPGNDLQQHILEASDNLSIPRGAHTFTVGARYEHTFIYNFFLSGAANGAYTFPTIDSLAAGLPKAYAFSYANGGDIAARFNGQQSSLYAQDMWNVTNNFSVTGGVRLDVPTFLDSPKQNDLITAQAPDIRTDWKPKTQLLWSPRLGFNWDVGGTQTTQIRGNIGVFTGQVPYILVGNAYANTGLGGVTVGCTGAQVPAFTTDVSALPKSCAGQPAPVPGAAGTAGINVTDPNFKYPQNFTTTLGFDHTLPWGVVGTFEALYRHDIHGLYVRDLNLIGPRIVNGQPYTDVNGRILYADTISATGSVTNTNQRRIKQVGTPPVNFSEGAIMLTNANAGYNYTLTAQLSKRFNRAFQATAAYTYEQARDVQSLTSDRAISNWRFGRQFSGLENDPNDAEVSNFQRPHRIIAYGTFTAPWVKNQTDVSFYFEGISGTPFLYTTNNDINGDGIGGNDPIYVPRDATDPNEIRVGTGSGANFVLDPAIGATLNRFIDMQPCLNAQRGHIMKRNSCQGPFQKRVDASLRQTLPEFGGQQFTLQLDIFNFLNLLNKNWGQTQFPVLGTFNNLALLQVAGKQPGPLNSSLFNYNVPVSVINNVNKFNSPWSLNPNSPSNNYQMQLSLRYAF
jgi:outer membrane receptor protein involved in Fe transport